jgi:hypothetical protein
MKRRELASPSYAHLFRLTSFNPFGKAIEALKATVPVSGKLDNKRWVQRAADHVCNGDF